jgi:hypothetical protein
MSPLQAQIAGGTDDQGATLVFSQVLIQLL